MSEPFSTIIEDASTLEDGIHRALFQYWNDIRGRQPLPRWEAFDVTALPGAVLPHLIILDVVAKEPPEFRFRLAGTHFDRFNGFYATGKLLSEVPLSHTQLLIEELMRSVDFDEPRYSSGQFLTEDKVFRSVKRIVLPMSVSGKETDSLLIATIFVLPGNKRKIVTRLGARQSLTSAD